MIPQEGRLGSGRGNRIRPREDSGPAEGGLGSGRGKTRVRPRESGPAEGRLGSGRGNRGQEPLPGGGPGARAAAGGTGGQSRCREDRGARAAAGRTGGKRRSWNGGRSRAHAVSRAVSETKQTNTKVLTLYEVHLPRGLVTPKADLKGLLLAALGGGGRAGASETSRTRPCCCTVPRKGPAYPRAPAAHVPHTIRGRPAASAVKAILGRGMAAVHAGFTGCACRIRWLPNRASDRWRFTDQPASRSQNAGVRSRSAR